MAATRTALMIAMLVLAEPAFSQVGQSVDPTENVKALNAAEAKRQDDLRAGEAKFQNAMREAETKRLNDLATQKQAFDFELSRILRANAEEKATLLALQVKEVKTDLDVRMSKQEQFRWETGGRGGGIGDALGWIMAVVMSAIAAGSLAVSFFTFWKRK